MCIRDRAHTNRRAPAIDRWAPNTVYTLHQLGWQYDQHLHTITTGNGENERTLRLQWDGPCVLDRWLDATWQARFWPLEGRIWTSLHRDDPTDTLANAILLPAPDTDEFPVVAAHQAFLHDTRPTTIDASYPVSYTHLTLPTNREV